MKESVKTYIEIRHNNVALSNMFLGSLVVGPMER